MAKLKGKGVVLAGLVAGAVSFFRKKENRDKVKTYLNQAKQKVNQNNNGLKGVFDEVQKVVGNNANGKTNGETGTNEKQKPMEKDEDTNTMAGVMSDTIQKATSKLMDDNTSGKMNDKDLSNTIQKTMDKLMDDDTNGKMDDKDLTNTIQKTMDKLMHDDTNAKKNDKAISKTMNNVMDSNTNKSNNENDLPKKVQDTIEKVATTATTETESERKGNEMVSEGGVQETVDVYNEIQAEKGSNDVYNEIQEKKGSNNKHQN